jgi:hypothetical protein
MVAAVMGNAAVAAGCQNQYLIFPGVDAQRPAMAEDDRPATASVFAIVLDIAGIFSADSKIIHDPPLWVSE